MQFKYNYPTNTLAYQRPLEETWSQVPEAQKFVGNFASSGFNLAAGWITFTLYQSKIRAFFKQMNSASNLTDFWEPQTITYFRKDLPKQSEVIFTFTPQDEVEKVGTAWIKKNKVLSETKGANHD